MKEKKTIANDCSFPVIAGNYLVDSGLTKREYFAAMAMQGFLSCNAHDSIEDDVKYSVKCADLLIEELNKTKQHE
jgi:hypothetical protein